MVVGALAVLLTLVSKCKESKVCLACLRRFAQFLCFRFQADHKEIILFALGILDIIR